MCVVRARGAHLSRHQPAVEKFKCLRVYPKCKERSEIGWVAKDGNHRRVHGGQSLAGLPKRDVVLATAAAIKVYNAKADTYAQVVQKKGQPLREGFSIAMVRAARSLSLSGVALGRCNLVT